MSEEVLTHRIQITGPRWYRWLVAFPAHVSHRLAALILLPVIAGVVATDVFARYFLHAPIIWAQDVATLTLLSFFMASMVIAAERDAHIRVETVYERCGPRLRAVIDMLGNLCGAVFCGLLAYSELHELPGMYLRQEATPIGGLSYWPVSLLTAAAAVLAGWVLCAKACLAAVLAISGEPKP